MTVRKACEGPSEGLTEEDDAGTECASKISRSGENSSNSAEEGGVLRLERFADLGKDLDCLEFELNLLFRSLWIDLPENIERQVITSLQN